MLKVMLINANGYCALKGYPFPRLVAIRKCDEEETRRTVELKTGLVRMSLTAICEAAPEWTPPAFWKGLPMSTLSISRGDHFADEDNEDGLNAERVFGWGRMVEVDENPFAYWNALKSSRNVGELPVC